MAARQPERILDDIVQKKGRGLAVRRKLAVNQPRNWMLALVLHSLAKHADKAELTDLERGIVRVFEQNGFSEEDIKQQAELGRRLPELLRKEIFPARYAQFATGSSYSRQDLRQDAPQLMRAVLAMPNVTVIDSAAIETGTATLADYLPRGRSALREHAGETLVIDSTAAETVAAVAPAGRYTVKAIGFRCVDRATDSFFGPSNEPYWIFGTIADGKARTTRSDVFGDVDSGESRTFDADDGYLWGSSAGPRALPSGLMGVLVSLWEHDEGDLGKIRRAIAAAFELGDDVLDVAGGPDWMKVVLDGIKSVLNWLLGFLDDDHIADQLLVVSSREIEIRASLPGRSFLIRRRFSDGDGDYVLTIKVTRVS